MKTIIKNSITGVMEFADEEQFILFVQRRAAGITTYEDAVEYIERQPDLYKIIQTSALKNKPFSTAQVDGETHEYLEPVEGTRTLVVEISDNGKVVAKTKHANPSLNTSLKLYYTLDGKLIPAEQHRNIHELQEIIDTLENDNGAIPEWLWKRIEAVKTPMR
jgi:hypothetical protein